jgi:hypothetical protein
MALLFGSAAIAADNRPRCPLHDAGADNGFVREIDSFADNVVLAQLSCPLARPHNGQLQKSLTPETLSGAQRATTSACRNRTSGMTVFVIADLSLSFSG